MGMFSHVLLILVIYFSSVSCIPNTTHESMKMGISVFNEAGNNFFNILRPRLDPLHINITEYTSIIGSFSQFIKGGSHFLGYYILVSIGVTFAVLMPLVGIIILLCRCCGKCGGKLKAMDPRNAKCKRIIYGLILVVLTTGMLFGSIISQFNNHIFHETVVNEDKSVNIFLTIQSNVQKMKHALLEIKESVNKSQAVQANSQQLQALSNDLDDNIRSFYTRLVAVQEVLHVIDKSKSLKLVLDRGNVSKSQTVVNEFNSKVSSVNSRLASLKERIKQHLANCSTEECKTVKTKTDQLQLSALGQDDIDGINKTLTALNSPDFLNALAKIIDTKDNNSVNMKLILEGELKYIKERINDKTFSDSMKRILMEMIDKMLEVEKMMEDKVPSALQNLTEQHHTYKYLNQMETYRYFWFLGSCIVIVVIVLCFYLGLMYGTFGGRPTEDASCCNKGVGARFLIGGVVLTFLFSSVFMALVIAHMLTTGVAHTEICRYTSLQHEGDARVLDMYIDAILKLRDPSSTTNEIMDALLNKCSNQNFYSSFAKVNQKMIEKLFEKNFTTIEDKVVAFVLSQFNLSSLLNGDLFRSYSSIDTNKLVETVALLKGNGFTEYLDQLTRVSQYPEDKADIKSVNEEVLNLRTKLSLVLQFLNNSENEYKSWKKGGQILNSTLIYAVKSQSPALLSPIQKSLLDVLSGMFNDMFKNVSCKDLRSGATALLKTVCQDGIDTLNGTWYGIGIFLILVIPALVLACLLTGLYRRIQNFYPDKEEPDYDNYIGFYARADGEKFKSSNAERKPAHRGYKPIPLQSMS